MSETYTAVLDRIVNGASAVLLLEGGESAATNATGDRPETDPNGDRNESGTGDGDRDDGEAAAEDVDRDEGENGTATDGRRVIDELVVDVDALPADGRHEGAVFEVRVDRDEGALLEAAYEAAAERERRDSARERFDRLSERLPDE